MKRSMMVDPDVVLDVPGASARPFLSWCLIVRNAEATLEACLKSIRERTPDAEIVIVDTCSSDRTVEIARRYADVFTVYHGPKGDWNEAMPAFDDAAAARNESFRHATGEWVGWIDADDILPGPEEATGILRLNGRLAPGRAHPGFEVGGPLSLEELIDRASRAVPDLSCFWAPYFYRAHFDGTAAEWQERERIVRNDGSWHWVGAGHEVLVPKNPKLAGRIGVLSSLVFKHTKRWDDADYIFSVQRHFNALIKVYDSGQRDARTCLYLENFAKLVAPNRRGEFLAAAYEGAHTPLDRSRCLMRAGDFATEQGFFLDAKEHYAGAVALTPSLADPHIAAARALEKAEQWHEAARGFDLGASLPHDPIQSLMNPRDLKVGWPVRAAECYRKASIELTAAGRIQDGLEAIRRAEALALQVRDSPEAGPDRMDVNLQYILYANERKALEHAVAIHALWDYLVRNEESEKAIRLIDSAPHTLEDHPLLRQMRAWAEPVRQHLIDPAAYAAHYNSPDGGIFDDSTTDPKARILARVLSIVEWIRAKSPRARILEIGSFDGPVALPILRLCPEVSYVAVDANQKALDHLWAKAVEEGLADRLTVHHSTDMNARSLGPLKFDAVIFAEIIEHVPDPVDSLVNLHQFMRPGARLFVSTPRGSFDKGAPFNQDGPVTINGVVHGKRDPRGHVRAMTAWDLVTALENAGFKIEDLTADDTPTAAAMYARCERAIGDDHWPVTFAVPSALWPWNASEVIKTGIGASEETIVYLARELAADPEVAVRVFGPLPRTFNVHEEVKDRVAYWPREKFDRIQGIHHGPDQFGPPGTVVVSRSPSFGRQLDPENKLDKVLWLQDVWYPDLNKDTAGDYRKIVCLTQWHKRVLIEAGVPPEKLVIIPNFLLAEHFEGAKPAREPHHFIYASSPDRGLVRLLKIWPRILEVYPDATLDIFYGWEGCMKLGGGLDPAWAKAHRETRSQFLALRHQKGVTERGRVNHEVLAREFQRASAWLYPTHFAETGCLTAAKARAAGCVPVCTPYAALNETADCELTQYVFMREVGRMEDPTVDPAVFEEYASRFVEGVITAVNTPEEFRQAMAEEAIEEFNIARVILRWEEVLGL